MKYRFIKRIGNNTSMVYDCIKDNKQISAQEIERILKLSGFEIRGALDHLMRKRIIAKEHAFNGIYHKYFYSIRKDIK